MATYLAVKEGSWFDIPMGALQSETLENLYGAGRMVWADDTAFAAVRVMGTCFATGHAAGVARHCRQIWVRCPVWRRYGRNCKNRGDWCK